MAVVNSQMMISPVIRQYFTDPITRTPVVGSLYFYKPDTITLKNVYQQTGDPDNPFEVAANPILLDTAGAIPFSLYLYPYDEDDNTVVELYYVELRRNDGSLVFALQDFPLNMTDSSSTSTSSTIENLCPSYGFDIPIYKDFYTETNEMPLPANGTFSSSTTNSVVFSYGWEWTVTDFSYSDFYYEYESVSSGTVDGNPINLVTLKCLNLGASQSYNYFGFIIGMGNELIDQTINYQFYAQDSSTIPVTNLTIGIITNSQKLAGEVPITIGNLTLDNTLSLRNLNVTLPDYSTDLADDNEYIWLVISLPLNQTFDISFTGTYSYIGDSITINRVPVNQGLNQSQQFFVDNVNELTADNQDYLVNGNPLSFKKGKLGYNTLSGNIFIAASGFDLIDSQSALPLSSKTLIRGQPLGDTITDRYLDIPLSSSLSRQAGNSFYVFDVLSTEFDVETNALLSSFTPWVSSTPDIVITQNSGTADHGISSVIDSGNSSQLNITFSSNYLANTNSNLFSTNGTSPAAVALQNPVQRVVQNTFGTYSYFGYVPTKDYFTFNSAGNVTITNTNPGSGGAAATCNILFSSAPAVNWKTTIQTATTNRFLYINYLSYLAFANAGASQMPNPPPFAIQVKVDGSGDNLTGTFYSPLTVDLDSSQLGSSVYIASQFNSAINNIGSYHIEVLDIPTNGAYLDVSTTDTRFVIICYNTTQAKPTNPLPGVPPIFLEYTSSSTISDICTSLQNVFLNDVGGIPTLSDLEDVNGDSLPVISDYLSYYVNF